MQDSGNQMFGSVDFRNTVHWIHSCDVILFFKLIERCIVPYERCNSPNTLTSFRAIPTTVPTAFPQSVEHIGRRCGTAQM